MLYFGFVFRVLTFIDKLRIWQANFFYFFVAFRRRVRNSKNSAVTFKITHCPYTRYYYLKSTLLTSDF